MYVIPCSAQARAVRSASVRYTNEVLCQDTTSGFPCLGFSRVGQHIIICSGASSGPACRSWSMYYHSLSALFQFLVSQLLAGVSVGW